MASKNQEKKQYLILKLCHSERVVRVMPVVTSQRDYLGLNLGSIKLRLHRIRTSVDDVNPLQGRQPRRQLGRKVFVVVVFAVLAIVWHEWGLPLSDLMEIIKAGLCY